MVFPKRSLVILGLAHWLMWTTTVAYAQLSEHNMLNPTTTWISLSMFITAVGVAMATTWRIAIWFSDYKHQEQENAKQKKEMREKYDCLMTKMAKMQASIDRHEKRD